MAILIDETKRVLVQHITSRGDRSRWEIDAFANCDYCNHLTATLRENRRNCADGKMASRRGSSVIPCTVRKWPVGSLPKQAKKFDKKSGSRNWRNASEIRTADVAAQPRKLYLKDVRIAFDEVLGYLRPAQIVCGGR